MLHETGGEVGEGEREGKAGVGNCYWYRWLLKMRWWVCTLGYAKTLKVSSDSVIQSS